MARWKVVHRPHVAVRSSPSVSSPAIGVLPYGEMVQATAVAMGGWIRLTGGPSLGWMLVDGAHLGYGRLMLPVFCTAALQAATNLALGLPAELLPKVLAHPRALLLLTQRSPAHTLAGPTSSHALYLGLFEWVVGQINVSLEDASSPSLVPPSSPSALGLARFEFDSPAPSSISQS